MVVYSHDILIIIIIITFVVIVGVMVGNGVCYAMLDESIHRAKRQITCDNTTRNTYLPLCTHKSALQHLINSMEDIRNTYR